MHWHSVGLGDNGAGTQLDWDTMERGHNWTGTQWNGDTTGLGHNGTGTERLNPLVEHISIEMMHINYVWFMLVR